MESPRIHGGDAEEKSSCESGWTITQLPRNTKNHAAAKNSNVKQVNHQTENRVCETFSDKGEESELKAKTRTTADSRVQSKGKVKNRTK
ncbi:unnamed protein product [Arabis nemorensis]|uniref:Uncharacterized protein n=1 Tax=Arabis nemorensis TaxID=586526 RepID=A0A565BAU3_9BRAS|nr:unnamed protein product [Arabis nemorensis]